HRARARSAVAESYRHAIICLSRLDPDRRASRTSAKFQIRHVAIRELQTIGSRLTHKGRVIPDNFRERIRELLQPGIVREPAVVSLCAWSNEEAKRVADGG